MICQTCSSEFVPPVGKSFNNCPYCGEVLAKPINEAPQGCETLADALSVIIGRYGLDALFDSQQLSAALGDLLPKSRLERNIIKNAFEMGIPKQLTDAIGKSQHEQQVLIGCYVRVLVDDVGIAQNLAEDVLWQYAEAVGFEKRSMPITAGKPYTNVSRSGSNGVSGAVESISIGGKTYETSSTQLELSLDGLTNADIEPLRYMTNLTSLSMYSGEKITDISVLGYLTNLNSLYIKSIQANDISALRFIPNLRGLSLQCMKIKNISVLGHLTYLTFLVVEECPECYDMSPLAKLTNLTKLILVAERVNDLDFIKNMTNLEDLIFSIKQASDINIFRHLYNLTMLTLWAGRARDISVVGYLTNLEELTVLSEVISDISALRLLTNLKTLSLACCHMTDISALKHLPYLKSLNIQMTQINDISALGSMKNLMYLTLCKNQISDISPLENLTNLERLSLTEPKVSEVSIAKLRKALPNCEITIS